MKKPCVYILQLENNQYYIGATKNLDRRLKEHRLGKKQGTKYSKKIKLLFYQEYNDYSDARKIENRLKKFKNKKIIEKIIKNDKITIKI